MQHMNTSRSSITLDNYDVALWITHNADEIRPSMIHMIRMITNLTHASTDEAMIRETIYNNIKRILHQESNLGLTSLEILIMLEDPGVQQIIDMYVTNPVTREVNNETN